MSPDVSHSISWRVVGDHYHTRALLELFLQTTASDVSPPDACAHFQTHHHASMHPCNYSNQDLTISAQPPWSSHFPTPCACAILLCDSILFCSLGEKISEPTSDGPWIPEESPASADIGWPMSYKGFFLSGDPSIMGVIADHYVKVTWPLTRVRGLSKGCGSFMVAAL